MSSLGIGNLLEFVFELLIYFFEFLMPGKPETRPGDHWKAFKVVVSIILLLALALYLMG